MKNILIILIVLTTLFLSSKNIDKQRLQKINTSDDYNFISINNILMWEGNNGDLSHDPQTDGNGLYWPVDSSGNYSKSMLFQAGLLIGGKIEGEIHIAGSTFRQSLQAGKLLNNGHPDDPTLEKYRIYKIRKDWRDMQPGENFSQEEIDQYQRDYDAWPVEDGAPWTDINGDGVFSRGIDKPKHEGDETLWFVANAKDSTRARFLYGTKPMALEIQSSTFAFNRDPFLKDMIFKTYKIINKGNEQIDSLYMALFNDTDLGGANDDKLGCDTLLQMGYAWNGDQDDDVYGEEIPAHGILLLDTPERKRISSFIFLWNSSLQFPDPHLGEIRGARTLYNNYFQGLMFNGNPMLNPLTNKEEKIWLSGDPVAGTGWYYGEGWPDGPRPGNIRYIMTIAPITSTPGDTHSISFAIAVGQGANNLFSIKDLRIKAAYARQAFKDNFAQPLIVEPELSVVSGDNEITLYWNDKSEGYDSLGYPFEGYRIWQYRDEQFLNPQCIAVIDKQNAVSFIEERININGIINRVILFVTENKGITRKIKITSDQYSEKGILNGSEYYFGLSAFAYNQKKVPSLIESQIKTVKVVPGASHIDQTNIYDEESIIEAEQTSGYGDGAILFHVVDAAALNNHVYKIFFSGKQESLQYSLVDKTIQDTVINKRYFTFKLDPDTLPVFGGFQAQIQNMGFDSIGWLLENTVIKNVIETKGANGVDLAEPVNVLDGRLNSTGKWSISAESFDVWSQTSIEEMNWQNAVGRARYEIRFTSEGEGSEYYLTGYEGGFISTAPFKNSFKAGDKVPFEIWTLGKNLDSANDDQQLIIKILDNNNFDSTMAIPDARWTQFSEDDSLRARQWERIFAYYPVDSVYPEVLPEWSGLSNRPWGLHKIGQIVLTGEIPQPGTVVQIDTWRPLSPADTFVVTATAPITNDYAAAKKRLDDISVFPNPYFGADPFGRFPDRNYMRFTNLPAKVTVRIFTLSGQLVSKIEKDSDSPSLDWDLRNINGKAVASGIYIAHLEMPRIGKKIMKLALVQDND